MHAARPGPLLLSALLQHLGAASGGERPARPGPAPGAPAWLPALGSAAFGYWCAALLGLTSAAKARALLAGAHGLHIRCFPAPGRVRAPKPVRHDSVPSRGDACGTR